MGHPARAETLRGAREVCQSFFSSLRQPMRQLEEERTRACTTCFSRRATRSGTPGATSPVTPHAPRTVTRPPGAWRESAPSSPRPRTSSWTSPSAPTGG